MQPVFTRSSEPFVPAAFAPAPDAMGFVRFLRLLLTDAVSAVPERAYHEPIATVNVPGTGRPLVAFVSDPTTLEEMLVRRPVDFPKSLIDDRVLRPAFGDSLLTAHGEDWRWKRRLAAPYFTPAALSARLDDMMAPFDALLDDWTDRGPGTSIDVAAAMTAATLEVVRRVLFAGDPKIDVGAIARAIDDYLGPISWLVGLASLKTPAWLPHPGRAKLLDGRRRMRAEVDALVVRQRAAPNAASGMCAALLDARDPATGRRLDDDDLTDMLLTLIAAGHETTANALAMALYCLAEQPELQDALRDEAIATAGDGALSPDHLSSLVLTEAFVRETLRLFPPAPLMARRNLRTETLAGQRLPPGTTLFIPIYAVHRHSGLWHRPERFDVERHLGADRDAIGRTAYMPFGAGPRICAGQAFAMMEMVGALATIVRRVSVGRADRHPVELVHRLTLRPKNGLMLEMSPVPKRR
ncbi:MAG: cytochrome P450 [Pseudomonadota bacterium]